MGGGKGTRFWPESTIDRPKQFMMTDGKKTMLRMTVDRLKPFIKPDRIFVVGNKRNYNLTCKELPDVPRSNIIAEPIGKNTAPCLGLASVIIKKRDPRGIVIAVPADQIILKKEKFIRLLKAATQVALKSDQFITFGITPALPHTGYGYIETGRKNICEQGIKFMKVSRFIEKPSLKKAKHYISSKKFYWNSGMFIFHVDTLMKAMKNHMPRLYAGLIEIEDLLGTKKSNKVIKKVYNSIPPASIDYGIMEKITNCYLAKADIGWNDVGGWNALYDVLKKDNKGNCIKGKSVTLQSNRNLIFSQKKLIVLVGINDAIVVQTEKATLVLHKDNAEEIKEIVALLERKKETKYL